MALAGLILAGGRSRRFGAEKAVAEVAGASMLERVLSVLEVASSSIAISAAPQSRAAAFARERDLACLHDEPGAPDGPLAGVMAGLLWGRGQGASHLITAPCDTPFLPRDFTTRLLAVVRQGAAAAVAKSPSGLQPLCALWEIEPSAEEVGRAIGSAAHPPIHRILRQLRAVAVEFADEGAFANINTQAQWARIAGREMAGGLTGP
ncbi:MAG: molybdenum cofactor guanylyltransferase [Caulobacteraceae bacterium]